MITSILILVQLFFTIIMGIYFFNLLKSQQGNKTAVERESKKELDKIRRLREIRLSEPLAEKARPTTLNEIVGQKQALKALRAALCGPNPQHVLIYGPPGVGKTAAARVILEEAKCNPSSPFGSNAKFVEIDGTTLRFDDRGIADPLIGSVHDPLYQGAGAYGVAGIPQPKAGAVTKAHGGVLFIDEIGELHSIQINKLLKVLEDRKVFLESAYYSSEDSNIPSHIHDIFQRGLPADFRLVGATTRSPDEIPPAIRSRCVEIYFNPLLAEETQIIARNASLKSGLLTENGVEDLISKYAQNGRDAVNIVQMAGGIAMIEGRKQITKKDVEWVVECGHYSPNVENKVEFGQQIGYVNGLAVIGNCTGTVIEIEVTAAKRSCGIGKIKVTGIIEQEEMDGKGQRLTKTSSARASVDNVITALKKYLDIDVTDYDVHLNFPGGMPIDGPSAGIAIATAIYSAITNLPVDNQLAMTGEISIRGKIKPVGGVASKLEAAKRAGIKRVLIPKDNWQDFFEDMGIEVIPVEEINEAVDIIFNRTEIKGVTLLQNCLQTVG